MASGILADGGARRRAGIECVAGPGDGQGMRGLESVLSNEQLLRPSFLQYLEAI